MLKGFRRQTALALLVVAVGSAGGAKAEERLLDLAAFFSGTAVSAGEVRTLGLRRERFTARFEGRAEKGTLRLDERFRFADGERLQRWVLRFDGAVIRGTVQTEAKNGSLAEPVAVGGEREVGRLVLRYRGIAPGGGALRLGFRHEIRPNGDGTLRNDVTVRFLGLPLARSEVTFARSEAALREHLALTPHP